MVTYSYCRSQEIDNHLLCCGIRHPDCDCWNCNYLEMEGEQSTQTSIHDLAAGRTVQNEQVSRATCTSSQQSLQESDSAARSPGIRTTQSNHAQTSASGHARRSTRRLFRLQCRLEIWDCPLAETRTHNDPATCITLFVMHNYIESYR